MILISTDKAVRPHNVICASKRVAKVIVQEYAKKSNKTCFQWLGLAMSLILQVQ